MASKLSGFLSELKRRKVYRTAAVYLAAGAGILGVADAALPSRVWDELQIPVAIVMLVGFPVALLLAWLLQVSPEEPRVVGPSSQIPEKDQRRSVVVLPFDNMSPDPDDAYFSDGLTEEIIADLSCCGSLRVISRTSAMALKGTPKSTRQIAEELDVQYVLEGSVRKAGEDLRITAQLIDARNDSHVWAEKYAGTLHNVLELQEHLSRQIVGVLKARLSPEVDRRLSERPIEDVHALDLYLQASHHLMTRTFSKDGLDQAFSVIQEALDIAGNNPLLLATKARVLWAYHNAGIRTDEKTLQEADELTSLALRLDPDLPQTHAVKGQLAYTRGDFSAAARHLLRSAQLHPDGLSLGGAALAFAYSGMMEEARHYGDWAVTVDPLNRWALMPRAITELLGGRYEGAISLWRRDMDRHPQEPVLLLWIGIAQAYKGLHDDALETMSRAIEIDSGAIRACAGMWAAALRCEPDAVRAFVTDWGDFLRRDTEISWYAADCLAQIGDRNGAIRCLEILVDRGFGNHRFLSEFDPFLAPLRGDQEFERVIHAAREKQKSFRASRPLNLVT